MTKAYDGGDIGMKNHKIALFDLDGTLADYDGQLLKDLQHIASPHEPAPVSN